MNYIIFHLNILLWIIHNIIMFCFLHVERSYLSSCPTCYFLSYLRVLSVSSCCFFVFNHGIRLFFVCYSISDSFCLSRCKGGAAPFCSVSDWFVFKFDCEIYRRTIGLHHCRHLKLKGLAELDIFDYYSWLRSLLTTASDTEPNPDPVVGDNLCQPN